MEHSHEPQAIAERLAGGPSASYLRDWVYGGIDGSVTTFAVVTGVVGAKLSPAVILILGAANLVADGFSMAAGNYSATRTERQEAETLRRVEERHLAHDPEGEREEVRQLCAAKGLDGVELEHMVGIITADRDRWIEFMLAEEYGVAPQIRRAVPAALNTFWAFAVCGLVPLLPFALRLPGAIRFSIVMTLIVFFAIGSIKSRWLHVAWWKAGIETLLTGGIAALFSYAVGIALRGLGGG